MTEKHDILYIYLSLSFVNKHLYHNNLAFNRFLIPDALPYGHYLFKSFDTAQEGYITFEVRFIDSGAYNATQRKGL